MSFNAWMDLIPTVGVTHKTVNDPKFDLVSYFQDLASLEHDGGGPVSALTPMVVFVLRILPFIPTTVICECGFSKYNTNMRADRGSMHNSNAESYMMMSDRSVPMENFKSEVYSHIYSLFHKSGNSDYQEQLHQQCRETCRAHHDDRFADCKL